MSLKALHLVFITAAVLLAFGFSAWLLKEYWSSDGGIWDLVFGVASLLAGVGLILYERYFLKRPRSCVTYEPTKIENVAGQPAPRNRLSARPADGLRRMLRPVRFADGVGNELGDFQPARRHRLRPGRHHVVLRLPWEKILCDRSPGARDGRA